jgi:hypothetical protein
MVGTTGRLERPVRGLQNKGSLVKRSLEEFRKSINELREALDEAMKPLLEEENGKLLAELMENQLNGIEIFYELLLIEQEGVALIDSERFDVLVGRYRSVLRYFTRFPGLPEKSTYKMSVVSDFYYLLSRHTHEWGRPED